MSEQLIKGRVRNRRCPFNRGFDAAGQARRIWRYMSVSSAWETDGLCFPTLETTKSTCCKGLLPLTALTPIFAGIVEADISPLAPPSLHCHIAPSTRTSDSRTCPSLSPFPDRTRDHTGRSAGESLASFTRDGNGREPRTADGFPPREHFCGLGCRHLMAELEVWCGGGGRARPNLGHGCSLPTR